jgi:DNA adenine methylase
MPAEAPGPEFLGRPRRTGPARPFLKWAGGKRQLLPRLRPYYPEAFGSYLEPFLGSAAVFFDLHNLGRLDGRRVVLADSSADLIGCYEAVRDHADAVIEHLEALEAGHRRGGEAHYYDVRDNRFNPARRASDRSPVTLAAMLIYLNRTGYNGLFRLNASGDFNVPMGRYERPRICDADTLRAASEALRAHRVELRQASFADSLGEVGGGDFVYLDPPYVPLTRTSNFTSYTAARFGEEDQRRLQQALVGLAGRGVWILLSNSGAGAVKALYEDDATVRAAGLRAHRVPARRAINSRASGRGPVQEYVITNVGAKLINSQPF